MYEGLRHKELYWQLESPFHRHIKWETVIHTLGGHLLGILLAKFLVLCVSRELLAQNSHFLIPWAHMSNSQ